MADTAAATAPPATLPAPPTTGFPNGSQPGGPHMPPPLNIPTNNNGMPPSLGAIASPDSASARRAAPEPNKRALYVGGLDPRVTEDVLKQIFETTGHVQSVKIIPDKNVSVPAWREWPVLAPQTTPPPFPFSIPTLKPHRSWTCGVMAAFRAYPRAKPHPLPSLSLLPTSHPIRE